MFISATFGRYKSIQARSLKRHKCQLCKRDLSSQGVVDDLNSTVEKFVERVPEMLAARSRMIEEAKKEMEGKTPQTFKQAVRVCENLLWKFCISSMKFSQLNYSWL